MFIRNNEKVLWLILFIEFVAKQQIILVRVSNNHARELLTTSRDNIQLLHLSTMQNEYEENTKALFRDDENCVVWKNVHSNWIYSWIERVATYIWHEAIQNDSKMWALYLYEAIPWLECMNTEYSQILYYNVLTHLEILLFLFHVR